jgi:hypothetical protein
MKTKNFKFSDLADFINSQNDDRFIEMTGEQMLDCGCVLTHFGRHKTHTPIIDVGFTFFKNDRQQVCYIEDYDNRCFRFITDLIDRKVKSYEQAKKIIQKYL